MKSNKRTTTLPKVLKKRYLLEHLSGKGEDEKTNTGATLKKNTDRD